MPQRSTHSPLTPLWQRLPLNFPPPEPREADFDAADFNATGHRVTVNTGRGLSNETGTSMCARDADCRSTNLTNLRVCESLWGTPVPCFSCSERVHRFAGGGEGFYCDPQTKTCACQAPPPDTETTDEAGPGLAACPECANPERSETPRTREA